MKKMKEDNQCLPAAKVDKAGENAKPKLSASATEIVVYLQKLYLAI